MAAACGRARLGRGSRVLTHCNTGALATGGYGSALGAMRAAWERWARRARLGRRDAAAAPGRAPHGVGARGARHPVLRDRRRRRRVAHGGGTRSTRCSRAPTGSRRTATSRTRSAPTGSPSRRRHHGLPFYVVAPTSTLDPGAATGAAIPIEERDPREVSSRFPARNPAFDVTPAELVTAIVTEVGVHRAPYAASLPASVTARHRDRRRRPERRGRPRASSGSTSRSSRRCAHGSLRASCRPSRTSSAVSVEPPSRRRDHSAARCRASPGTTRRAPQASTLFGAARSRRSSSRAAWRRASAASSRPC